MKSVFEENIGVVIGNLLWSAIFAQPFEKGGKIS
jgi:hypothetical protein